MQASNLPSIASAATEIRQLHGEILTAAKTTVQKAVRIGELLAEVKAGLKHGQWLPWLKENLPFSDRTARNYIRLHEERGRLKLETVSDLTSAYRLLAEPKPKAEADIAETYHRPELIPAAGTMLVGTRALPEGGQEVIQIAPSTDGGFYVILLEQPMGMLDVTSGPDWHEYVSGTKHAIKSSFVGFHLIAFLHRIPELFTWETVECDPPWHYNIHMPETLRKEKRPAQ